METGTVVLTVGRVPAEQTGGRKEPVGKTDGFWTGSEKDASLFPSIGHRGHTFLSETTFTHSPISDQVLWFDGFFLDFNFSLLPKLLVPF